MYTCNNLDKSDKGKLILKLQVRHKYLTSTNMPTVQQKKGYKIKKNYWSHTAQIREALLYLIKSLRLCNKLTATFT